MDYTTFLNINCDWQSNVDGLDIKDCVVARQQPSEHETSEIDIFSLIEDSKCKCVNFMKSDDQKDLFIKISCDPKHLISKMYVCSEAKIVELFGKNGEYVSTHSALSSQSIEYTMNSHFINVNSRNCSLKFEQLKNTEFAWIYGILVFLKEAKEYSNKSLGPINMQNVQHLVNPESLATNASKLFSSLSLKESKSDNHDFLNSILNYSKQTKLLDNDNNSQFLLQKQFQKKVEERLNTMTLQLNNIGNNVETLNKKIDTLLNALHEKHIL